MQSPLIPSHPSHPPPTTPLSQSGWEQAAVWPPSCGSSLSFRAYFPGTNSVIAIWVHETVAPFPAQPYGPVLS